MRKFGAILFALLLVGGMGSAAWAATVNITHDATDFDGNPLTPAELADLSVRVMLVEGGVETDTLTAGLPGADPEGFAPYPATISVENNAVTVIYVKQGTTIINSIVSQVNGAVTRAYDVSNGNQVVLELGPPTVYLYHYVRVKVFATDTGLNVIDPNDPVLARMGLGVDGGGSQAYDQVNPTLVVFNNTTVALDFYFDGVIKGSRNVPIVWDENGKTEAYTADGGNAISPVPPGAVQGGMALLVSYNVVALNIFATDTGLNLIDVNDPIFSLLEVSINGGAPQAYNQTSPSLAVLDEQSVTLKVYFNGQELTGFFQSHQGGIPVASGVTKAFEADNGNTIQNPPPLGTTFLIAYNVVALNIFATDTGLNLITDPNILNVLEVSINGGVPQPYNQTSPSLTVLDEQSVTLKVYFNGQELTGFFQSHQGGIPVASGVTKAFEADNGNTIQNPPPLGTTFLIAYNVVALNIFATDTGLNLITDPNILNVLEVSINGGVPQPYNQTGPTLTVLDGQSVTLKVYFNGQELTGFFQSHQGGIPVASGVTKAFEADNGNVIQNPPALGTMFLIAYEVLALSIIATDSSLNVITDPNILNILEVSIDGGAPQPYNQTGPSLTVLDGQSVTLKVYANGQELTEFFQNHQGGIPVASGVTKAFEASTGNIVPNPPNFGTTFLIAYEVIPLNIFATNINGVITDPNILNQLAVGIYGSAPQPFNQTGPSLDVVDGQSVVLRIYFNGQELTGFFLNHQGGIPAENGLTKAFEADTGNIVPNPPNFGTTFLIAYEVLALNIFATDTGLNLITDPNVLNLMEVSINGGAPQPYNQTGPSLSLFDGQSVTLKVYFDGDELTGFFQNHQGGIPVASGVTKAFEAENGNTIQNPPALGTTFLIAYDVNEPPVADAGPDTTVECASSSGTAVTLDGTGSSDPDGDPLTFSWSASGITFDDPTIPTPTGTFPLGTTTVTLTVTDPSGESDADSVDVTVVDTTPPVVTLEGPNPMNLELGTSYEEPGATALDACDGEVAVQIDASSVDVTVAGAYDVIYTASDAAGNPATEIRTVNVLVTANSYVVLATNSARLKSKSQVRSGHVAVNGPGEKPFLHSKYELAVGSKVRTAAESQLSGQGVRVDSKAIIAGTLYYETLKKNRLFAIWCG